MCICLFGSCGISSFHRTRFYHDFTGRSAAACDAAAPSGGPACGGDAGRWTNSAFISLFAGVLAVLRSGLVDCPFCS